MTWTEDDVRRVLVQPLHVKAGIVSREDWIACQENLLDEMGTQNYFAFLFGEIVDLLPEVVETA